MHVQANDRRKGASKHHSVSSAFYGLNYVKQPPIFLTCSNLFGKEFLRFSTEECVRPQAAFQDFGRLADEASQAIRVADLSAMAGKFRIEIACRAPELRRPERERVSQPPTPRGHGLAGDEGKMPAFNGSGPR